MPSPSQLALAAIEPGLWTCDEAIAQQGFSSIGLARRILDLDSRIYPVEAHGHVGSAIHWAPVFEANPDGWGALANGAEEVVAYWRIAALGHPAFARAQAGLLDPFDVDPGDCHDLGRAGVYDIYFVRACIDPAWREISTRRLFADCFFAAAERLALRGVRFRETAAVALSDDECRICEDLGLAYLHDAPHGGAVFGGAFVDALLRLGATLARRRPKLVHAYLPKAYITSSPLA